MVAKQFYIVICAPHKVKQSFTSRATQLAGGARSSPHCQAGDHSLFILASQTQENRKPNR